MTTSEGAKLLVPCLATAMLAACGDAATTPKAETFVSGGCTNGVDDDEDGVSDCRDTECAVVLGCRESACDDGVDNDGDGASDCADSDCAQSPLSEVCSCLDQVDNDLDRAVDCLDSDCAAKPECAAPPGMVRLSGGTYTRGCDDVASAAPEHEAEIPAFDIDVDLAGVADYVACIDAGACTAPPTYEDHSYCTYGPHPDLTQPIRCVTWTQQEAFCAWRGARLCTEAEWDFAFRPGGPDGKLKVRIISAVGSASELVQDCWRANFGKKHPDGTLELAGPTDGSAYLTPGCTQRVGKGLSSFDDRWPCLRGAIEPDKLYTDTFVRCCADADAPAGSP
ncbi:MAG: SUMF1/EgtB/PvdO family nonheme iron enzyme [Myxococcota bacterium]